MSSLENKIIDYASFGDSKNLLELVNEGVNINTPSSSSFPLFEAISKGHLELVQMLVNNKNINLNRYDKSTGYTALHAAIFYSFYRNDSKMLEILVNSPGININLQSIAPLTRGFKAIHLAAHIGYIKGVELLIEHGAKLSDLTEDGLSVLQIAGKSNSYINNGKELLEKLHALQMSKEQELIS